MRLGLERAGVCLALFYPLYLGATLARALIMVVAGVLLGQTAESWDVSRAGFNVRMRAADVLRGDTVSFQVFAWVVLVAGLLLLWLLRKRGAVAHLFVALLAQAPVVVAGQLWVFRREIPDAGTAAAALMGLVLAALALRRLRAMAGANVCRQFAFLLLVYAVPLALVRMMVMAGRGPARFVSPVLAVGAAACALAMVRMPSLELKAPWSGWAVAGVALSAVLWIGAEPASRMLRLSRESEALRIAGVIGHPLGGFETHFFQRGVSFTAESGDGYASEVAREMLLALPQFKVDAVALIPYDFGRGGGRRNPGSMESEAGMAALAALAHNRKMRVMLKPHIRKPGEQELATEEARRRWFEEYTKVITHYAEFARFIHADLFCVGTEFAWLTRREAAWRAVIAEIRKVYPGPLTYASNWGEEFERIGFWDALDYIGVDNYYPLGEGYDASAMVARIEAVQKRFGKPVLFTEAGYSSTPGAARKPYHDELRGTVSLDEQEKCYEALLKAFYNKPWFAGMYWWKVGTNGFGGAENSSMTPWRKPAMDLLYQWYKLPREAPRGGRAGARRVISSSVR